MEVAISTVGQPKKDAKRINECEKMVWPDLISIEI